MAETLKHTIQKPHYPIIYVRGYAMRKSEREETFYDTYYGFSATSVEKRQAPPPQYFEPDVFEGQLIRLMKMDGYTDAFNQGLECSTGNPSRSVWICRFYDLDYIRENLRSIEDHAEELHELICATIPRRLKDCGVDLGTVDQDYKVILLAHSMGGLVCRTLIQNLLPIKYKQDPKRWIHRIVTMGTPHGGIELGKIPDFLENFVTSTLNPFDANIFKEERMREYLKLDAKQGNAFKYDIHSLGAQNTPFAFPIKRCLCIIGSDYQSYNAVREVTGNFSDGLVKQDRAYMVAGDRPQSQDSYPDDQTAYYANVHRAHSGYRGIVNSYESYENIRRFLFGDVTAAISLDRISLLTPQESGYDYFYDFEFLLSVRKTGAYLHQRQQDPCENALRVRRAAIPTTFLLHNAFMNSTFKEPGQQFSHFVAKFRVLEHRIKQGLFWDHEYPERPIYNETVEIRVGDIDPVNPGVEIEYRWLSDGDTWIRVKADNNWSYRFPLRAAGTMAAEVVIRPSIWPDQLLTQD